MGGDGLVPEKPTWVAIPTVPAINGEPQLFQDAANPGFVQASDGSDPINLRLEDGHGSDPGTPSHVSLVRDAQNRHPVTAHNPIGDDVAAGVIFTVGDEVVLGAGQSGALVLENPVGSGKVLVILGFNVDQNTTTSLAVEFFLNPTVTGGTTLTPINHAIGGPASAMVAIAGQGILSGGVKLHADGRVARDQPLHYAGPPFIVSPGLSLGLQMTAPGGLGGGATFTANVAYKEV